MMRRATVHLLGAGIRILLCQQIIIVEYVAILLESWEILYWFVSAASAVHDEVRSGMSTVYLLGTDYLVGTWSLGLWRYGDLQLFITWSLSWHQRESIFWRFFLSLVGLWPCWSMHSLISPRTFAISLLLHYMVLMIHCIPRPLNSVELVQERNTDLSLHFL